ncbi:MAG: NAD(P)-dependent alcohol dehydrogenase [Candidatus Acetothermia bacterium]
MKAMTLKEPGKIIKNDLPKPSPGPTEVAVEIKNVGVCGSDMEYYETGRIGEFVVEEPIILGHEAAGQIVEVGKDVENLQVGDRVALEPGIPCRKCEYCKHGRYNLCPDVEFMATPPYDGAFVEYLTHPEDFAFKLPKSVSYEEGALIEPFSVGIYATERAKLEVNDKLIILGAGPIGLSTLIAASAKGITDITVTDVIDFRLNQAKELGAEEVVNVSEESIKNFFSDFDKVIQTAGTGETYQQAIKLSRRGGTVVQVGTPAVDKVEIDPNLPITREIDLVGAFRYANTYPKAISLLKNEDINLKAMVSKYFSLEEVEQALQCPKDNPDKCIKAMIDV